MADAHILDSETALDPGHVSRGVSRLLFRQELVASSEVTMDNGRRVDVMEIDAKGHIVIVEIKVSRADLLGDCKWSDYLDYCDRFFWAVRSGRIRSQPLRTR